MNLLAHKAAHIAAVTLNNPFGIGSLSLALIVVPIIGCLLYTSPSPRDRTRSRMPSSA